MLQSQLSTESRTTTNDDDGQTSAQPEPFVPMSWSLAEIRASIPKDLFIRNTATGLAYLARDLALAAIAFVAASYIDPAFKSSAAVGFFSVVGSEAARWAAWATYWWFQGLIFTGLWVIGHECGHGAFSPPPSTTPLDSFSTRCCGLHTFPGRSLTIAITQTTRLWSATRSLEYEELLGDTPIFTLLMLIRQQLLAFPAYLLFNVSGQKTYPKWTNHFDPGSILFTPGQWRQVMMSNLGLATVGLAVYLSCCRWGAGEVVKYYGIPWLLVSHWFILITYLHHTDPTLPHYRGKAWNYQRGAAATVDRDVLGWQGRFFLHDVAHFHVIHHFFPKLPFYNAPEATQFLKQFIGEHYNHSSEPIFEALWNSYNKCQFVEDTGDVLFYRDRLGHAVREPAGSTL